jgi:hypothetical protein
MFIINNNYFVSSIFLFGGILFFLNESVIYGSVTYGSVTYGICDGEMVIEKQNENAYNENWNVIVM